MSGFCDVLDLIDLCDLYHNVKACIHTMGNGYPPDALRECSIIAIVYCVVLDRISESPASRMLMVELCNVSRDINIELRLVQRTI